MDLENKEKHIYPLPNFELIGKVTLELERFGKRIGNMFEEVRGSFIPLLEIDWSEVERDWKDAAEKLASNGWTLPMNMTPVEIVKLSNINSLEELDKAFEDFYSTDEYERIKVDILEHKLAEEWKELLKQCFDNYEKGTHSIAIPNLFIVIENIAHILISPRFQKYITSNKNKRKPPLREQYTTVKQEIEQDRTYLIIYVSVMTFLHEVFKAGNFDKNTTRYQIINRDWVLHGRDNPSNWKRADALRLFLAVHSILELDFLLEEPSDK